MTTVDAELDLAQLRALLAVAGALKVITGAHACGAGTHPDPGVPGDFDQAICDAYAFPVTDPRHFVHLDVVDLREEEALPGIWRATTDDGSFAMGEPGALLRELQRWRVP